MKKQMLLALTLLASMQTNNMFGAQGNAGGQVNAVAGNSHFQQLIKAIVPLLVFSSLNYQNGAGDSYEYAAENETIYGASTLLKMWISALCISAMATDNTKPFVSDFLGKAKCVTFGIGLLYGTNLIANNKKFVKGIRKTPIVNSIFTDPMDKDGNEFASVRYAARCISTYLILRQLAIQGAHSAFGFDLKKYTIEG